jgi:hypothetical protein
MKHPKSLQENKENLNSMEYFNELKLYLTAKSRKKNAMAIYAKRKTFVKNLQTFHETTPVQQVRCILYEDKTTLVSRSSIQSNDFFSFLLGICDGHTIRNGISTMHLNPVEKNKQVFQHIAEEKSFHQDNGVNGHKNENKSSKIVFSPQPETGKGNIFCIFF